MKLASVLILAVIFSVGASPLRAELYEFEVRGTVAGGFLPIFQVNVGDEVTFRYTLDSTDQDPSAMGWYHGTTAVFETPSGTYMGDPAQGGDFTVRPFSQIASFDSYMPGAALKLSFRFPEQTLLSDELPLSLPVATATTRSFFVNPSQSTPSLFGTITSYEGRLVPEPNSLCVVGVACAALRRRI